MPGGQTHRPSTGTSPLNGEQCANGMSGLASAPGPGGPARGHEGEAVAVRPGRFPKPDLTWEERCFRRRGRACPRVDARLTTAGLHATASACASSSRVASSSRSAFRGTRCRGRDGVAASSMAGDGASLKETLRAGDRAQVHRPRVSCHNLLQVAGSARRPGRCARQGIASPAPCRVDAATKDGRFAPPRRGTAPGGAAQRRRFSLPRRLPIRREGRAGSWLPRNARSTASWASC